ncbi:MAG: hypothetical protein AMS22_00095 [Thiotrichales bacterium SG8_50]|nr:MAG: hypothetical protein AMS22_00095 [Thiotrichales bacterium SG8_50]
MVSRERLTICVAACTLPVAAAHAEYLGNISGNSFNPAISLILDGKYTSYDSDPEDYRIPGFQLGPEAELAPGGFSAQHSELAISANVDDWFYGALTAALATHEGETSVELEEAYIETLALGAGFKLKAGRFYSGVGYLNQQHAHRWDFADTALVYRALFGNQLSDDGVQLSWVAPTDVYLMLGAEISRGERFPAAGAANDGAGAASAFAKVGGDVGDSHAWQAGLSYWSADVEGRESGGDAHDGGPSETASFTGDSTLYGLDVVWKWAPHGNPQRRNLKLQFEYFARDESGDVELVGSDPLETSSYDGTQRGWYAQAVYQFIPRWRVGLRYDQLEADNDGSDPAVLAEAGLDDEGYTPQRYAVMVDYSHSEYSRLRLQYNRDESYPEADNQWVLQYVMSLGAHGAHRF